MPEHDQPVRISEICLRPGITVRGRVDGSQVRALVEQAHGECYVANGLSAHMTVEPTVVFLADHVDVAGA